MYGHQVSPLDFSLQIVRRIDCILIYIECFKYSILNVRIQKLFKARTMSVKVTNQPKGSIQMSLEEELLTRQQHRQKAANGCACDINYIHSSD